MSPLSARERAALIRILGISSQDGHVLESRRKAALDAYLEILSRPPLDPVEVVAVARALIRVWAEVGTARRPAPIRETPSGGPLSASRSNAIFATLLDPETNVTSRTETMSPMALTDVFERFGYV